MGRGKRQTTCSIPIYIQTPMPIVVMTMNALIFRWTIHDDDDDDFAQQTTSHTTPLLHVVFGRIGRTLIIQSAQTKLRVFRVFVFACVRAVFLPLIVHRAPLNKNTNSLLFSRSRQKHRRACFFSPATRDATFPHGSPGPFVKRKTRRRRRRISTTSNVEPQLLRRSV